MKQLGITVALIAVGVLGWCIGIAVADNTLKPHFVFLGASPDAPLRSSSPNVQPKNYMSANWALTPTASVNAWAVSGDIPPSARTAIAPLARTAVSKWNNSVSGLV